MKKQVMVMAISYPTFGSSALKPVVGAAPLHVIEGCQGHEPSARPYLESVFFDDPAHPLRPYTEVDAMLDGASFKLSVSNKDKVVAGASAFIGTLLLCILPFMC